MENWKQVKAIEEQNDLLRAEVARLEKELSNANKSLISMVEYDRAVQRANLALYEAKLLRDQLEAQEKLNETLAARLENKISTPQQPESIDYYKFKHTKPITSVEKFNGERCTVFAAVGQNLNGIEYVIIEISKDRKVCLRREEFELLVDRYFRATHGKERLIK